MSSPAHIVEVLERIAFGYELLAEEPMRARAFAFGARVARQLGPRLVEVYESGKLARIRGIGKSLLRVIGEAAAGNKPAALEALEERIPGGLFEARRVRGLGPRRLKRLWDELEVTSLGELEYACNENRLVELEGFGAKTQAKVLAAIRDHRFGGRRLRRDRALGLADRIVTRLREALPQTSHVGIAGPLRRGQETVEAVDLVVLGSTPFEEQLCRELPRDPEVTLERGERHGVPAVEATWEGAKVRVAWCDVADRHGIARLYATGSAGHLRRLEGRAAERGLTLDVSGLRRGDEGLACATEEALYHALGLLPTAPERRDLQAPLTRLGRAGPALIRRRDLRGALHNHTTASDGLHSLEDMRAAAAEAGLEYLGISDHSVSASYAGGLSVARLRRQLEAIAAANAEAHPVRLLSGTETDIHPDGSVDFEAHDLARLDCVVASVHSQLRQSSAKMTARLVAAARHPLVHVIGHPTGRLLLSRPPSMFDLDALLEACAESGCAVELNANPQRLDLDELDLARAKERGVPVSIAADAHSAGALLGHLDYGISIARRAGLGPEDVLNCLPLEELTARLRRA